MQSVIDGPITVKDRIWFIVPNGLDHRAVLPRQLWDRADEMYWFVNNVVRKTKKGKTDRRGYVYFNRKITGETMSERTITPIQNALVAAGVLERTGHWAGEHGTGFRLPRRWKEQPVRRVRATDRRLIDRIKREMIAQEQRRLAARLPVHDELDQMQKEMLTIEPGADELAASIPDPIVQHRQQDLVRQVRNGRPGSRSFTGRWYSPFCCCKKTLRHLFRLDGEPLGGYDLRCAQPALLAVFLGSHFTKFAQCVGTYSSVLRSSSSPPGCESLTLCHRSRLGRDSSSVLSFDYIRSVASGAPTCGPDLVLFTKLTLDATFYEFLLERARAYGVDLSDPEGKNRSELNIVKLLTLKDVLAKKGSLPSDFARMFREIFPTVYAAMRWINSRHSPPDGCGRDQVHGKLVRILQRLESALVIETVCPLLLRQGIPVLPLHDCVFTGRSRMEFVKQAFEEVFRLCGVEFKLKPDLP